MSNWGSLIRASLQATASFFAGMVAIKKIKYFVDSHFREQVEPVPGSVLYCDLLVAVEHSGIYVGDDSISNIVVDSLLTADSRVRRSSPSSFTSKSLAGKKIYVSCDKYGAVGCEQVAEGADSHVGEPSRYGLVYNNCHTFSTKCVEYAEDREDDCDELQVPSTWEITIGILKRRAREKLGATKWRLWDWDGSIAKSPPEEPDWQDLADQLANQPLNPQSIAQIRAELVETQSYIEEIADESIPTPVKSRLQVHRKLLQDIDKKYEQAQGFLALMPDAQFSYNDLTSSAEDFSALARAMQGNAKIKDLVHKMGRAYISEQRKKQGRIPSASRSEVHGTHRSDDVMRLLPSELLNLEDETLENLFYARLMEKQLQTYELHGTTMAPGETHEDQRKRTGPVVACLDTSGSMDGAPLLKAKALLLATAHILQTEKRSLHVLLFGQRGEIREFALEDSKNAAGLLRFLQQGFDGGTDYETPLGRAFDLIASHPSYQKVDVLMISDGDCQLSAPFAQTVAARKTALDCMVYSVLCDGQRVSDNFSDEVVVL